MAASSEVPRVTRAVSPHFYILFRAFLGIYLAVHFFALVPVAAQLFSSGGMLPRVEELPTYPFFPNILFIVDQPIAATAFLFLLGVLSLVLASGRSTAIVAVLLWYGWACLVTRNVFIRNPGMPYVGWILLALPFIPTTTTLANGKPWDIPKPLYVTAWILMSLGYTLSGIHKLQSPSWIDGSALKFLFENPLSRPTLMSEFLSSLPEVVLRIQTWGVLFLETSFAFWAAWKPSRRWIWLATVLMHIGIMVTVDFVDLTLGMLMIHLFTFDQRWIPSKRAQQPITVFFDGVCNLCNKTVNALMLEDVSRALRFAPLQGETAAALLPATDRSDLPAGIVVADEHGVSRNSDAVIRICEALGGVWRLAALAKFLPRSLREGLYLLIARNRYQLLGKRDTCRFPTPEERSLFLP